MKSVLFAAALACLVLAGRTTSAQDAAPAPVVQEIEEAAAAAVAPQEVSPSDATPAPVQEAVEVTEEAAAVEVTEGDVAGEHALTIDVEATETTGEGNCPGCTDGCSSCCKPSCCEPVCCTPCQVQCCKPVRVRCRTFSVRRTRCCR